MVVVRNSASSGPPSILLGYQRDGYRVGTGAALMDVFLPADATGIRSQRRRGAPACCSSRRSSAVRGRPDDSGTGGIERGDRRPVHGAIRRRAAECRFSIAA
jgi:hypothetical protein